MQLAQPDDRRAQDKAQQDSQRQGDEHGATEIEARDNDHGEHGGLRCRCEHAAAGARRICQHGRPQLLPEAPVDAGSTDATQYRVVRSRYANNARLISVFLQLQKISGALGTLDSARRYTTSCLAMGSFAHD